ncbi:protein kinase domain-containing protein [Actinomarinicola tropica]|uniref:non-specific serine/threonine protein kinase n=1 Tax=Actinomarinicola tropica TaxID=2789776 RepID=A0A5Q2RJD3_9ACTN|nr:protein kinase [Actinomarinicola tropica]QGG96889.1 protein kinase [Actinomarinicola tropica]
MPEHSSPVPSSPADLDGRLLGGRYRVGPVIATGGMAQVRRATDEVLGRAVALKLLHPHLAADPTIVDRFRHEALAAARLSHPAIVSIYDTIEDDVNAIVMELVEGITLRQFLDQQGPLSPKDAVDVVAGVADALQAAHEAGIVHRDVKPANILLCEDRRVMVTDFGIAKAAVDQDLTSAGTMIGTAKYLAPEQVRGDRVDPRTDVYALGVVLYECLCGRPPFEADTDAATALARLHRDPLRPRQVRPSVPPALDDLTMQALQRDPDDRPTTTAALRAALLAADHHDGGPARDLTTSAPLPLADPDAQAALVRGERRWLVPTLLVVLVGGALVLAAVLIGRTDAGQDLFDRARGVVGTDDDPPAATEPAPLAAQASAYDPQRGDGENDDLVGQAVDGDPATTWPTEFYSDRQLGSKDGVGIVLTLDEPAEVHQLVVTSPSDQWSASVHLADAPSDALEGWGEPVTTIDDVAPGTTTIDLGGRRAGAVLLWITDLGPGPAGELRVEIAEAEVVGR